MDNKNTKLTQAGLVCLLLCVRSFASMTFFPLGISGGLPYMAAAVLSTAVQGFLIVPAALLAERTRLDPCQLAFSHRKAFGRAVTLLLLVWFLYGLFRDIGDIAYFTDYFFSVSMPRVIIVLCCALTAVYAARAGLSAIGRAGQAAFAGVVIMLVIIAAGAAEDMDFTALDLAVPGVGKAIFSDMVSEGGRCECLVLFSFLASRTEGSAASTARRFLLAKAAVICVIVGMTTAVLGGLMLHTKLPVFTLAAASENLITQRSDAVFLLIWLFTGLVRLALVIWCAGECIRYLFPKTSVTGSVLAAGLLPAAAAVPILSGYGWDRVIYSGQSVLPIFLLVTLLPLLLQDLSRKRKELSHA